MCTLLAAVVATVFAASAFAADTGFIDKTFKDSSGTEHKYVLFVPHDYKKDKPSPTILFLPRRRRNEAKGRGEGQRYAEDAGRSRHRPGDQEAEKTFPFLTIIPQAPPFGWGCRLGWRQASTGHSRRS